MPLEFVDEWITKTGRPLDDPDGWHFNSKNDIPGRPPEWATDHRPSFKMYDYERRLKKKAEEANKDVWRDWWINLGKHVAGHCSDVCGSVEVIEQKVEASAASSVGALPEDEDFSSALLQLRRAFWFRAAPAVAAPGSALRPRGLGEVAASGVLHAAAELLVDTSSRGGADAAGLVLGRWASRAPFVGGIPAPAEQRLFGLFSGPKSVLTTPLFMHGLLQLYLADRTSHQPGKIWGRAFGEDGAELAAGPGVQNLRKGLHNYIVEAQKKNLAAAMAKIDEEHAEDDPIRVRLMDQWEQAKRRAEGEESDVDIDEELLVFEALCKLVLRPEQVAKLRELTGVVGTKMSGEDEKQLDLQRQAPMGVGKSDVYTPFWVFTVLGVEPGEKRSLPVLVIPDQLYVSGVKSLRKNLAKFSDKSVFQMEFGRVDAGAPCDLQHVGVGKIPKNPFVCPLSELWNALQVASASQTPVVTRSRDLHMLWLNQVALTEEIWQLWEQYLVARDRADHHPTEIPQIFIRFFRNETSHVFHHNAMSHTQTGIGVYHAQTCSTIDEK